MSERAIFPRSGFACYYVRFPESSGATEPSNGNRPPRADASLSFASRLVSRILP